MCCVLVKIFVALMKNHDYFGEEHIYLTDTSILLLILKEVRTGTQVGCEFSSKLRDRS